MNTNTITVKRPVFYAELPTGKVSSTQASKNIYAISLKNDLREMIRLIGLGRKIIWSPNKRWCTIGTKTFNMCKEVFEKLSKEEVRM